MSCGECQGKPVRLNHQPIVDGKLANGPPKKPCCDTMPPVEHPEPKQTIVQRQIRPYRPARA